MDSLLIERCNKNMPLPPTEYGISFINLQEPENFYL